MRRDKEGWYKLLRQHLTPETTINLIIIENGKKYDIIEKMLKKIIKGKKMEERIFRTVKRD